MKKEYEKNLVLRKNKLENENSEIINKYSSLNKEENNQHQLNIDKLKNKYKNDINNLNYDIKIENLKNIKTIVEIIYNTYNSYNNNYYNSLNIIKMISIFYQNNYFQNKNKDTLKKIIKNDKDLKFKTFKEEIKEYKNKLKQISEENENLKDENYSLNFKINQLNKGNKSNNELDDFNERIKRKEFDNTNFYDIIINIKSIKDIITKGWEVKMTKRYYEFSKTKNIKVGVLGNSNVGKTFLLSKLSKFRLPHGIKTEGLSIKYPDLSTYRDRRISLIDFCGFETPILTEENEKKNFTENKELLYDKIYTEMFLQNFILDQSDIPILVIGNLTFCEQKLLDRIKSSLFKKEKRKILYVVHNLKNFSYIQEVKDYINNVLLKCPNLELEKGSSISKNIISRTEPFYYYEKNQDSYVYHLLYAKENSEAGTYYNKYTLHFLENSYIRVINIKCFDVKEEIKNSFRKSSIDIFKNIEKNTYLDFDDSSEKLIKLGYKNELLFRDICLNQYELPILGLESSDFIPSYNFYKKDHKFIVKIEAPGNFEIESDILYRGEYCIININGNKKKDKDFDDNLYNSRKFGDFAINIPLKVDEFNISNDSPEIASRNGILTLEFKLAKKFKKVALEEEV